MIDKKIIFILMIIWVLPIISYSDDMSNSANQTINLGLKYEYLFPFTSSLPDTYSFSDASCEISIPLHIFYLLVSSGVFFTKERVPAEYSWSHNTLYVKGGLQYIYNINNVLQIGAQATSGFSWASLQFPAGDRSLYNILADTHLFFRFRPQRSVSIQISPSVRYCHSLTLVKQFDGFHFGLGSMLCYHIKKDVSLRKHELKIFKIEIDPVFAALKNFYPENQVGWMTIENRSGKILKEIRTSLFLSEFMDYPSPSLKIKILRPGEKKRIKICGVFNDNILSFQEMKSLSGQSTAV